MVNLLEHYSKRLAIAEGVYSKEHGGETLSDTKKLVIARVLANESAFLNEALGSQSRGVQRSDMGTFRKFVLDLTTVALPNCIANDLVIVHPMSSITGFIQYIKFTAGTNKGGIKIGDKFSDAFSMGPITDDRIDYTGDKVTEVLLDGQLKVVNTPVIADSAVFFNAAGEKLTGGSIDADGTLHAPEGAAKVTYKYDNILSPQESDVPLYTAKMDGIALAAKARRIGIQYSQMAAFQAKTEMGVDLGQLLQTQAVGELTFEIDLEVTKLLDELAGATDNALIFNKRLPVGVSKKEHYAGIAETMATANQIIYDRTQRYGINYVVMNSSVTPLLSMLTGQGWEPVKSAKINGPYLAGSLNGVKCYVSGAIARDRFICGFNGGDAVTSAAVFAPYMAIVPTQLLGFMDGTFTQGFATMYDIKPLNSALLVAGKIVDEAQVVEAKVVNA